MWVGDTEDIATALAHAEKIGMALTVESHDFSARQWRVTLAGNEIVIRERARAGRVREAVAANEVTESTVTQARRYAEAAQILRPKLEAYVKTIVETGPDFATEVVHIGEGLGGVMHRDTRYEEGLAGDPHSQLALFANDGPMTNRGALRSGQDPDHQTMPGVRTREHTIEQAAYTKSQDLGEATLVGRLESQTPAYRADAIALERRADTGEAWTHPDKQLRIKVRAGGAERWIYCNRFENAGGMGVTNFAPAKALLGADTLAEMRTARVLLAGDDPDLSTKLHANERVLVWGGSPTGAWAGEDASLHGSTADIVGESQNVKRNSNTKANEITAEEFEKQLRIATVEGDSGRVAELIRERIAKTHGGSLVPRNHQPGAAYGPDAASHGIHVELGVPTAMRLLPDGTAEVTIGVGEHPGVRVYDRVVMALGQDPSALGGPAGLLGGGVTKRDASGRLDMNAPVPDGTIALHMILDRSNRLVGLESEDGSVRLIGAAYAHPRLAAWVIPSERAAFEQKASALSTAGERTHTGGTISADSDKVTTGIEAHRDRIPVANEVVAAREYRLPTSLSADRLALPTSHPETWAPRLEDFLTTSLRARPGRVEVIAQPNARDGVHLFRVINGGEDVGLLRVYDTVALAEQEAQLAERVHAAVPSLEAGVDRGTVALDGGAAAQLASHPRAAGGARATSYEDLVEVWTRSTGAEKQQAYDRLAAAVTSTARTLAQVHERVEHQDGVMMTAASKQQSIDAAISRIESSAAVAAFGTTEVARLRVEMRLLADAFMAAKLPVSAELGRADADAFGYRDYKVDPVKTSATRAIDPNAGAVTTYGVLSVEDLGAVNATGQGTGAADLAQYLESLRRDPRIASVREKLEVAFMAAYKASTSGRVTEDVTAVGTRWYSLAAELARLSRNEPGAAVRVRSLIEGVQP